MDGEKLMVSSSNFDDGSMIVSVGTTDFNNYGDSDFMEIMINKDGKIDYFTLPTGKDDYQRMYKIKPSHYGTMKTQNETNESAGGDFIRIDGDGKYAESFGAEYRTRANTYTCPEDGCRGCEGCYGEDDTADCACCDYVFEGPTGFAEHATWYCQSCDIRACAGCVGEDDPYCDGCGLVFEHTSGPFDDDGNYIGKAESFGADSEKCPKCDAGNLGKEEMYYCYTCGNDNASEDGCSKCGSDNVGEDEMDYCYNCGEHGHWFNAESFGGEAIPIRHSRRLNGYYAIKGYEDASEDGFIYRIYRAPGTNDWFRATVYDDNSMKDNFIKPTSRRLNPSGKMVISNDPPSLLIGAFPKLEDAKRALVFRMIQDGNYHRMMSDGNLKWLLKDYYAESFGAESLPHTLEDCKKRLGIAEEVLSMSDAVQTYNKYLLQEMGIDRYADDELDSESFGAEPVEWDEWIGEQCQNCKKGPMYEIVEVEEESGEEHYATKCKSCDYQTIWYAETLKAESFNERCEDPHDKGCRNRDYATRLFGPCHDCLEKMNVGQYDKRFERDGKSFGAELLDYPHSMSDRQKHRIRKLGGRIDKAMSRSQASQYIKSLMRIEPLHAETHALDCSACQGWGWNEDLNMVCDADGCIGGWIVPKKPSLLERGLELGAGVGMGVAGVAILFGVLGGTVGFAAEELKKRRD